MFRVLFSEIPGFYWDRDPSLSFRISQEIYNPGPGFPTIEIFFVGWDLQRKSHFWSITGGGKCTRFRDPVSGF